LKLAALIDWEVFDREWQGPFRPARGAPRHAAGLLYLQYSYRLSDKAMVVRWFENLYCQRFTSGGRAVTALFGPKGWLFGGTAERTFWSGGGMKVAGGAAQKYAIAN
jgi:hypothetical protein